MGNLSHLRVTADTIWQTEQDLIELVRIARANGATWAAIGSALRMSRQAAQQRFGSR